MAKKYKLHCFGCGEQFYSSKEVHRIDGKPYCGECLANIASGEIEAFLEKEWHRKNPGLDYEEEQRKQYYLNKYGEY